MFLPLKLLITYTMKKILLSAIITSASFCAFAQTPTWDFENWTGTEPTGWISENELMILGNPQSAFKETTAANVHSGTSSLKLVTVTMTAPVSGLPNPIGLAAPGSLSGFKPKFGMKYTARPASVDFWYKYTPVATDSAEFLVLLWNSTTGDTIAFGYKKMGATTGSSFTSKSVALTYNPAFSTEFPDSMGLTFSATKLFNSNYSFCSNCGTAGSTLWVDDVMFSGSNGIHEHLGSEGITLFPNPANEFVTISVDALNDAFSITTYDMTGRAVCTTPLALSNNGMNRKAGSINTSNLAPGLYTYSVTDRTGATLRAGKFSIVR
jgi:hypothetical protein